MPIVFLPEPIAPSGVSLLLQSCACIAPWSAGGAALLRAGQADTADLARAEAIVVRLFRVDAAALDAMPLLRVIAKHGVGLDNVDLDEARRRRIPVVCTPDAASQAVAEHAVALLLALARRLGEAQAAARQGRFHERTHLEGFELSGRTLGIIGLGRIGRRVARIAAGGFGMRVLAYDPYAAADGVPAELVPALDDLLAAADAVTLHVPLTPQTRGLIDAARLRQMRPGALLVNTARGAVIDEDALVQALTGGRLGGAALDVFAEEPLPADHPLCRAPNTVLTPHVAGTTASALDRTARMAAQAVLDELGGVPSSGRVP